MANAGSFSRERSLLEPSVEVPVVHRDGLWSLVLSNVNDEHPLDKGFSLQGRDGELHCPALAQSAS